MSLAFLCQVSFAFLVIAALIRVATFFIFVATVVDLLLLATRLLLAASVSVTAFVLFLATIFLRLARAILLLLAALSGTAILLLLATTLDNLA